MLNTHSFIEKAKLKHGNKYDYSKTDYLNNKAKLLINCNIHGEFKQTPHDHLSSGAGCPKCAGNYMDKNYFIEKATLKHGNKYDYTKVNYINSKSKVNIICSIHDEFETTPSAHLLYGCPKCAGNYMDKKYFIENAIKTHGNM